MLSATKRVVCRACRGTGLVRRGGKQVQCVVCRGTGKATGYQTKGR